MIAKGMLCLWWSAQTEAIWMEANGQMEGKTPSDEDTMRVAEVLAAYIV